METNVLTSNIDNNASAVPPATGSSRINVDRTERIISIAAGTLLGILAIRNLRSTAGKILGLASVILLKRGATGYCEVNSLMNRDTANRKASAMEIKSTLVINKPRSEVYAYWRNFENIPEFMHHLKEVKMLDERRSKWTARVPGGLGSVSWESMVEEESENNFLSWCSLPGSTIDNAGEISFKDAPQNRGTEIKAHISYRLPAGDVGSMAGKLFNPVIENLLKEDLRRFKAYMETGEIPLTTREQSIRLKHRGRKGEVTHDTTNNGNTMLEQGFPAMGQS